MKERNQDEGGIEMKPLKEQKKIHGEFFVAVATILLFFESYLFLFHTITPFSKRSLCIDIIYILLFLLVIWCYYIIARTPAGSIPLYWGFYIGDDDEKRKRYCLICNAFKPERSKHCSVCNTCVLNMDHHCPWVNNCIGFFNRKYFMQFIIYVEILFIYISICSSIYIIPKILLFFKNKYIPDYSFIPVCVNFIPVLIMTILFGKFVLFHIKLVLDNSSTIESLDQDNKDKYKKFKLSKKENIEQVFGKKKLYWFLPIINEAAKPVGDGLLWKIRNEEGN
jgi:palmitoyltransferase